MRTFITSFCLVLCVLVGCGGDHDSSATDAAAIDSATPVDTVQPADLPETSVLDAPTPPDTLDCPMGQTRCGDICVDTRADPVHCASCEGNCRALPGVNGLAVTCEQGLCGVHNHCTNGFADCDGIAANGCEADLSRPESCGACGITCAGATPACTATPGDGGVVRTCTSGCTAPSSSRCGESCTNTQTDFFNCGRCGNRCSYPNAVPSCVAGTCALGTCATGYADCDHAPMNGCEVVTTTTDNCGACGHACPSPTGPNAGARCVFSSGMQVCDIVCVGGYVDCDSNLMNGCEATTGNCTRDAVLFTEHFETPLTRWSLDFPWRPYDSFFTGRIPFAGRGSLVGVVSSTDACSTQGNATMTTDIDVSRTTDLSLQFMSYSIRGRSDGPGIEVSTDHGGTWTTVDTFALSTSSDWTMRTANLHAFVGRPTLRFRFHYQSMCPGPYLEWDIDEVTLQASVRNY